MTALTERRVVIPLEVVVLFLLEPVVGLFGPDGTVTLLDWALPRNLSCRDISLPLLPLELNTTHLEVERRCLLHP